MAIFVDEMREYVSGEWCHMWTDETDAVLDNFAKQIGLKKSWSHTSNGLSGRFYHYDLRLSKREQAIQNGAVLKPLREWIKERVVKQLKPLSKDEQS